MLCLLEMGVRLTHYAVDEARIANELELRSAFNSYVIHLALEALTAQRSAVCRLLSTGYRRWWIGAMAHAFRIHSSFVRGLDVTSVNLTLATILRDHDVGVPLPPARPAAPFPVIPDEDVDFRMSVVSAESFAELRNMFTLLLAVPAIRFRPPPGHELSSPYNAPTDYDRFDAYVREAASALLVDPRDGEGLVSFIG
jgi:hypothetical protein